MNARLRAWAETLEWSVPGRWLEQFDADPALAVTELVEGRSWPSPRSDLEPEDVIADWVIALGDVGEFRSILDGALADWIAKTWDGVNPAPAFDVGRAWCRAANIVAYAEVLAASREELARRFDERRFVLGPLSVGPTQDPLGRFLVAVARGQRDRQWAREWSAMAHLPSDVAPYQAGYVIRGIRGMPPHPAEKDGKRTDVACALAVLADALDRCAADGRVSADGARAEFRAAVRVGLPSLPELAFTWNSLNTPVSERAREWMSEVLPNHPLLIGAAPPWGVKRALELYRKTPPWKDRATESVRLMERGSVGDAVQQAERLLADQREYADLTGEGRELARTLRRLSTAIRDLDPARSLEFAEEAARWSRDDPYAATVLFEATRAVNPDDPALELLVWSAVQRFPENAVVWTNLGEWLLDRGQYDAAVRTFRHAIERFGIEDPRSWVGFAKALEHSSHSANALEALSSARDAVRGLSVVPMDADRLWAAAARLLIGRKRFAEAEALLRDGLEVTPKSLAIRRGLARILAKRGRAEDRREALDLLESAPGADTDHESLIVLARVWGDLGDRDRAETALTKIRDLLGGGPSDARDEIGPPLTLAETPEPEVLGTSSPPPSSTPTAILPRGAGQATGAPVSPSPTSAALPGPSVSPCSPENSREPPAEGERASTPQRPSTSESGAPRTSPASGSDRVAHLPTSSGRPRSEDGRTAPLSRRSHPISVAPDDTRAPGPVTGPVANEFGTAQPPSSRGAAPGADAGRQTAPASRGDRRRFAALVSEASLRLRWVRRATPDEEFDRAATLQRIDDLLKRAESIAPLDPRAVAERARWLSLSGDTHKAVGFAREHAGTLPRAPTLATAWAQLERAAVIETHADYETAQADAFLPVRMLQDSGTFYAPLWRLEEVRTCLALHDGAVLAARTSQSVADLAKRLHGILTDEATGTRVSRGLSARGPIESDDETGARSREDDSPYVRWARRIGHAVFADGASVVATSDGDRLHQQVMQIRERVRSHVTLLDDLSEELVGRIAAIELA